MKNEQLISTIESLSKEERDFLINFGDESVLRKLMTSDEIKICNTLFKKFVMQKGMSDDTKPTVVYYVDSFVRRRL